MNAVRHFSPHLSVREWGNEGIRVWGNKGIMETVGNIAFWKLTKICINTSLHETGAIGCCLSLETGKFSISSKIMMIFWLTMRNRAVITIKVMSHKN